jgi:hypothetical protein
MIRITATILIFTFIVGIGLVRAEPAAKISASPLQQSIDRIRAEQLLATSLQSPGPRPRARGSLRQHLFATLGAFGGMVAGGYIGVKIEGDRCRCDDPGLSGFVIGAPIGMVVGGVLGYKLGR